MDDDGVAHRECGACHDAFALVLKSCSGCVLKIHSTNHAVKVPNAVLNGAVSTSVYK